MNIDNRTLGACLGLGAVGLLILGVQPLLYGIYVRDELITEPQLGMLAAVEVASIAVGSALGVKLSEHLRPKWIAVMGAAIYTVGNIIPADIPILVARPIAGLGGGLLVSLAALAIAQRADLNRAAALFLFLQATSQYAVLQWFSGVQTAETAGDVQTVFVVLTIGALILFLPFTPPVFFNHQLEGSTRETPPPSPTGLIALFAAGVFVGGTISIWAYLGLWLDASGSNSERAAHMLTICLAGQVVGALLAAGFGSRGRYGRRIVVMSSLVLASVFGLLVTDASGYSGWALIIVFGVSWLIVLPAITGFLEEVDPARGSVPYAAAAQLAGAALFPTLLGYTFAGRNLDHVLIAGTGTILLSVTLVAALLCLRAREIFSRSH